MREGSKKRKLNQAILDTAEKIRIGIPKDWILTSLVTDHGFSVPYGYTIFNSAMDQLTIDEQERYDYKQLIFKERKKLQKEELRKDAREEAKRQIEQERILKVRRRSD